MSRRTQIIKLQRQLTLARRKQAEEERYENLKREVAKAKFQGSKFGKAIRVTEGFVNKYGKKARKAGYGFNTDYMKF